jgi:hypothetical protein
LAEKRYTDAYRHKVKVDAKERILRELGNGKTSPKKINSDIAYKNAVSDLIQRQSEFESAGKNFVEKRKEYFNTPLGKVEKHISKMAANIVFKILGR